MPEELAWLLVLLLTLLLELSELTSLLAEDEAPCSLELLLLTLEDESGSLLAEEELLLEATLSDELDWLDPVPPPVGIELPDEDA